VAYRGDHAGAARDFCCGFLFAAFEAAVENQALPALRKTRVRTDNMAFGISSTFASGWRVDDLTSGSRYASVTWADHDPLYFVDSNSIELCNLVLRHPVVRQRPDATELGGRNVTALTPDRSPTPYRFRFGGRFDLRRANRPLRQDRKDAWLAPRLVLRRRCEIGGGRRHVCTCGLLARLEKVFGALANSADPFAIITSVRCLPFR